MTIPDPNPKFDAIIRADRKDQAATFMARNADTQAMRDANAVEAKKAHAEFLSLVEALDDDEVLGLVEYYRAMKNLTLGSN
jgi:hypothetical protein